MIYLAASPLLQNMRRRMACKHSPPVLLFPRPSYDQLFSAAPYSQRGSSHVLSSNTKPSFTPIQNNRQYYSSVYFNLILSESKLEDKRYCTEW